MYKFRSMCADGENKLAELQELNEKSGPVFKIADDPRITRVGKWIRKLSLDEMPQFFNVLKCSCARRASRAGSCPRRTMLSQGRAVLAVPGRIDDPASAGPNALIAAGVARPIVSDEAFEAALAELGL